MLDMDSIRKFIEKIVFEYEKTAPAVSQWADLLYIRLNEDIYSVKIIEVITAHMLLENDTWEHPNYAANRVYKLMDMLGQDTTGLVGF